MGKYKLGDMEQKFADLIWVILKLFCLGDKL